MTYKRPRAIGGLATVLTLLALIIAHTIHPEITLGMENRLTLLILAAALLGLDKLLERLPIGSLSPVRIGIETDTESTEDDRGD